MQYKKQGAIIQSRKEKTLIKFEEFGIRIVSSYCQGIAIRFAIEERGESARSV